MLDPKAAPKRSKGITAAGGKLHSYYMTFGEYDFLSIIEAPDEKTVIAALAVAAAGGGVTDLKTTIAVDSVEMRDAFERAKSLALTVHTFFFNDQHTGVIIFSVSARFLFGSVAKETLVLP